MADDRNQQLGDRDEPDAVVEGDGASATPRRVPLTAAAPLASGGQGGLAAALAQGGGGAPGLAATVGGVRGLLEAVVPVTVFSVVYGVTRDLTVSAVAAVVPSVVFAAWRLARRETLSQAVSGLLGVALGAFIATRTGRAENFFLPNIVKNLAYMAAYVVSALVRWPLIGVVLGFFLGEGTAWRQVPARRRAYTRVTWLWAGMFGIRLAVQVPLWAAGMTVELGTANIFLGLPLFGLVVWGSWLMLRGVPVVHQEGEGPGTGDGKAQDQAADRPEEGLPGAAQTRAGRP